MRGESERPRFAMLPNGNAPKAAPLRRFVEEFQLAIVPTRARFLV